MAASRMRRTPSSRMALVASLAIALGLLASPFAVDVASALGSIDQGNTGPLPATHASVRSGDSVHPSVDPTLIYVNLTARLASELENETFSGSTGDGGALFLDGCPIFVRQGGVETPGCDVPGFFTSAAWNGSEFLLVGSMNSTRAGVLMESYTPANNTLVNLTSLLPASLESNASWDQVAWNGTAFEMLGAYGNNSSVFPLLFAYDPSNGSVENLTRDLPTSFNLEGASFAQGPCCYGEGLVATPAETFLAASVSANRWYNGSAPSVVHLGELNGTGFTSLDAQIPTGFWMPASGDGPGSGPAALMNWSGGHLYIAGENNSTGTLSVLDYDPSTNTTDDLSASFATFPAIVRSVAFAGGSLFLGGEFGTNGTNATSADLLRATFTGDGTLPVTIDNLSSLLPPGLREVADLEGPFPNGLLLITGGSASGLQLAVAATSTVTFAETGLPMAANWSVSLGGPYANTTGPSLAFPALNGTSSYSVGASPGYAAEPEDGSVLVDGSNATVSVAFSPLSWVEINETTHPPAQSGGVLADDPADGYLVYFGTDGSTWTFSHGSWSQISPTNSPPAMTWAGMTYDVRDRYVVLLDGNQTWKFSGGEWTQLHPENSPQNRTQITLTYDYAIDAVLLYGGWEGGPYGTPPLDDTWEYADGNWTQLTPTTSPGPLDNYGMTYDPALGEAVLFGGNDVAASGATWAFTDGNWTSISTAESPPARSGPVLVWSAFSDSVIMFGGCANSPGNCNTDYNDTWELSSAGWTQLGDAGGPPPQIGMVASNSSSSGVDPVLFSTDGTTWELEPETTSAPAGIVHQVPFTLENNQSIATPRPFDQMVDVDSAAYASYEASDLQNVEFGYPNGKVIPSWLESGSASASQSVYWLNLTDGIPADASVTIDLDFASPSANLFNGRTVGEAPELSGANGDPGYGAYDDGSAVFPYYENFTDVDTDPIAGEDNGVAPPGWYYTPIETGCDYSMDGPDGWSADGVNGCGVVAVGSDFPVTPSLVVDIELNDLQTVAPDWQSPFVISSSATSYAPTDQNTVEWDDESSACNSAGTGAIYGIYSTAGGSLTTQLADTYAPFVLSVGQSSIQENYSPVYSPSGGVYSTPGYLAMAVHTSSYCGSMVEGFWVRERAPPPNGVMPAAVFPGLYPIEFVESGLPTGTAWTASVGGVAQSSSGSTLDVDETNGTYDYTVGSADGYEPSPASGAVSVLGSMEHVAITFTEESSGAPPGGKSGGTSGAPASSISLDLILAVVVVLVIVIAIIAIAARRRAPRWAATAPPSPPPNVPEAAEMPPPPPPPPSVPRLGPAEEREYPFPYDSSQSGEPIPAAPAARSAPSSVNKTLVVCQNPNCREMFESSLGACPQCGRPA